MILTFVALLKRKAVPNFDIRSDKSSYPALERIRVRNGVEAFAVADLRDEMVVAETRLKRCLT